MIINVVGPKICILKCLSQGRFPPSFIYEELKIDHTNRTALDLAAQLLQFKR